MRILIDTREQNPLTFEDEYIEGVTMTKLDIGDYAVQFKDSHVPPLYFERKSITDLFGSLGKGYNRFKKEIERAQSKKATLLLIVEGTLLKVLRGTRYSTMAGITVVKKLFTLWIRYGVIPVFCKDREEMAKYITQFYIATGKEYLRKIGKRKLK